VTKIVIFNHIVQWRYSAWKRVFILMEVCNYSANSSPWNVAWKRAPLLRRVTRATTTRGYTSAISTPTWRPATQHGRIRSSSTSAKCLAVSKAGFPSNATHATAVCLLMMSTKTSHQQNFSTLCMIKRSKALAVERIIRVGLWYAYFIFRIIRAYHTLILLSVYTNTRMNRTMPGSKPHVPSPRSGTAV